MQSHRSATVFAFGLAAASAVWAVYAPAPSRSQSVAAIVPTGVSTSDDDVKVRRKPVRDRDAVQLPEKWAPSRGRECGRHKRKGHATRSYCQGPRKVPLPFGADARRAKQLGLGSVKAASHLILTAPKPEWTEAAGKLEEPSLLWPVEVGKFWRGFESKRPKSHKHRHKGIDIGAPQGSLIRAVQSGIVAYSDNEVQGYGNLLVTVHPDGSVGLYAHCRAIYVFAGQRIERGQPVAEVGATGISRGAHLHFEYRSKGWVRDPMPKFESVPCGPNNRCEDVSKDLPDRDER